MTTIEATKLSMVKGYADDLIKQFAPGHKIRFNGRLRRCLGQLRPRDQEIVLNRNYALYCDFGTVLDTVIHEITHARAGARHGHDRVWQREAIKFGVSPRPCKAVTMHLKVVFYE